MKIGTDLGTGPLFLMFSSILLWFSNRFGVFNFPTFSTNMIIILHKHSLWKLCSHISTAIHQSKFYHSPHVGFFLKQKNHGPMVCMSILSLHLDPHGFHIRDMPLSTVPGSGGMAVLCHHSQCHRC